MKPKIKDPNLPAARICIFLLVMLVIWVFVAKRDEVVEKVLDGDSIIISKELHFYDTDDGMILIKDTQGNKVSLVGEEGSFMRAVLRTLAKERTAQGVGPEKPFKLTAFERGTITLHDPVTGRKIDVTSFGENNAKVFLSLLKVKEETTNSEEG